MFAQTCRSGEWLHTLLPPPPMVPSLVARVCLQALKALLPSLEQQPWSRAGKAGAFALTAAQHAQGLC
jgi:hypothetical protein